MEWVMTAAENQTEIQPASRTETPLWAWSVGTVLGAGHLRPGPGTWGSLAGALAWWVAAKFVPGAAQLWVLLILTLVVTIVGIRAATLVARGTGRKDPSQVVIDEVVGQWVALLGAPLHWKAFLAGFILFRAFDIIKPPPVRQLESLPEGIGIVVDDLGAGLYALIIMQLMIRFGILG